MDPLVSLGRHTCWTLSPWLVTGEANGTGEEERHFQLTLAATKPLQYL